MAEEKMIFGIPVYITDAAPEGQIIFGAFPTELDLQAKSLELGRPYDIYDWIEDHPTQFHSIKNLTT